MSDKKDPITLTAAAAARVKTLLSKADKKVLGLRLGVDKKGCSGLAYKVAYAEEENPADIKVQQQGVTVYVTPDAALYLYGSVMDYVDEPLYAGFRFENPNAKGTCGCGESFHV